MKLIADVGVTAIDADISISFAANVQRIADVGVGVIASNADVSISFAANVKLIADVGVGVTTIDTDVSEWLRAWDTLTMSEATVCGRS